MNYPNPFNDQTSIIVEHDKTGKELIIKVNIFNIIGQVVRIIETDISSTDFVLPRVIWNGNDENGNKVGRGIYPYSVTVTEENGEITLTSGSLVIL